MKIFKLFLIMTLTQLPLKTLANQITQCDTEECYSYFQQYKKYAKAGHADAMARLSELYLQGYGTSKNLKLSMKFLKQGAKYGSVQAQYKLGITYLVDKEYKDIDKGIRLLKKAARNKHIGAKFFLGVIYYRGNLVDKDLVEADKWLAKAYYDRHPNIRSYINQIEEINKISSNYLPKLADAIANGATKNARRGANMQITWPEDKDIEVIEVSSPTLIEYFDSELASFKNAYPQKGAELTGTKIIGRTCTYLLSCGEISKEEFKRMLGYL